MFNPPPFIPHTNSYTHKYTHTHIIARARIHSSEQTIEKKIYMYYRSTTVGFVR